MDPLHIVLLVISGLLTVSQFVASNFPQYATAAHAVAGVLSLVVPYVVTKQASDAPSPVQAQALAAAQAAQAPLAPQVAAATQALDDELKRAASGGVPGASK